MYEVRQYTTFITYASSVDNFSRKPVGITLSETVAFEMLDRSTPFNRVELQTRCIVVIDLFEEIFFLGSRKPSCSDLDKTM